jgi:pimeloyl-ACP methyl ester carboxylesterase
VNFTVVASGLAWGVASDIPDLSHRSAVLDSAVVDSAVREETTHPDAIGTHQIGTVGRRMPAADSVSSSHGSSAVLTGGRVRSPDGTEIGYLILGAGPTLLCTHGAFSSGAEWMPVAGLLADRYRLVLMDRRGHGSSGDHSGLTGGPAGGGPLTGRESLDRECEDLAAVLGVLGGPVTLLGHSIGGCLGLIGGLRPEGGAIERMVAIEPPLVQDIDEAKVARFRELLADGRYEQAVIWGFRDVQGLPEKALDRMRRNPRSWTEIVSGAPMMVRHWEMALAFPKPAEFASLDIPTLLIHGSRSEERPFKHSTRVLAAVLPDARLEVIEGHNHVSMSRDPEPVADRIRAFLDP